MKGYIAVFAVLALTLVTGSVFADEPGYSGDQVSISSRISAGSAGTVDADTLSVSQPVQTGAVPAQGYIEGKYSPADTHYNPFYPERRMQDAGGGGN